MKTTSEADDEAHYVAAFFLGLTSHYRHTCQLSLILDFMLAADGLNLGYLLRDRSSDDLIRDIIRLDGSTP